MKTSTILISQYGILVIDYMARRDLSEAGMAGVGIFAQRVMGTSNVGSAEKLFRMEPLIDGSYRIVAAAYPEMVFDIAGASQDSGAPLILWPWHGGPNQRFRLKNPQHLSNTTWGFSLKVEHSGKVLDVFQGSLGEYYKAFTTKVGQWDYHGGPNQLFRVFGNPIKPLHSDLVFDVAHGSQESGAPVGLWPFLGGANQLFRLEHVPDNNYGAFRIVVEHSGKVLDVEKASQENGARLIQWDWHGGQNQLFRIMWDGSGGFSLFPRHSNKCIDVKSASSEPGAQLIQWDWHGGLNQQFRL